MQYKINISIDDVSPHPLSSTAVLETCNYLIDYFPNIKFTLFVPVAYWRTMPGNIETRTEEPLALDKFPDFCETLRNLPIENFEIGYHGLYHGIPGKSNNDEFQYLTKKEAFEKFSLMNKIIKSCDLSKVFKPIFRPPAWRMSPDAIEVAAEVGIEILALSQKEYAKQTYQEYDEKFEKVVYYNVNPPLDPLEVYEKTEIVYHACEWDQNYLDKEKAKDLKEFLEPLGEEIEFCFIENLA